MIDLTAREIRDGVASGALRAAEVCRACLDRITATDGPLHAFLTIAAERALARASAIDASARNGHAGPLVGVPIAYNSIHGAYLTGIKQ